MKLITHTGKEVPKISGGGKGLPRPILFFIAKGLLLFIVWKILYLSWLQPGRILDDPLTTSVGIGTTKALNGFSGTPHYSVRKVDDRAPEDMGGAVTKAMEIYRNGEETLKIADPCNGLELMVLYAGFLLCYPGTTRRKTLFLLAGWALIFLVNILRCALLVLIFVYYRTYLDFSHHFAFTFVVYALIFLGWYLFTKKPRGRKEGSPAGSAPRAS